MNNTFFDGNSLLTTVYFRLLEAKKGRILNTALVVSGSTTLVVSGAITFVCLKVTSGTRL